MGCFKEPCRQTVSIRAHKNCINRWSRRLYREKQRHRKVMRANNQKLSEALKKIRALELRIKGTVKNNVMEEVVISDSEDVKPQEDIEDSKDLIKRAVVKLVYEYQISLEKSAPQLDLY